MTEDVDRPACDRTSGAIIGDVFTDILTIILLERISTMLTIVLDGSGRRGALFV